MNLNIKSTYQSPSRVILAEGNISLSAAGTFPENDGRTGKEIVENYLIENDA